MPLDPSDLEKIREIVREELARRSRPEIGHAALKPAFEEGTGAPPCRWTFVDVTGLSFRHQGEPEP